MKAGIRKTQRPVRT